MTPAPCSHPHGSRWAEGTLAPGLDMPGIVPWTYPSRYGIVWVVGPVGGSVAPVAAGGKDRTMLCTFCDREATGHNANPDGSDRVPACGDHTTRAWDNARIQQRRVFYEAATDTIRQWPENYMLCVRSVDGFAPAPDAASPLNGHSLGMALDDCPAGGDGDAVAAFIEGRFWGRVGGHPTNA